MDTFDAIRLRRSIKPEQMKSDPIERALLDQLFEAANWAPSHGLTEPWRFIVFTGEARRALGEIVASAQAEPPETLTPDDPRFTKMVAKFMQPPVVAAIVCAPSTSPKIVEHEELASTAMAVQNLHLAARAMGLAGFWSSGKKAFDPRVARFLALTPPARCLGFFFLGWPNIPWPQGERRPAAEKIVWRET